MESADNEMFGYYYFGWKEVYPPYDRKPLLIGRDNESFWGAVRGSWFGKDTPKDVVFCDVFYGQGGVRNVIQSHVEGRDGTAAKGTNAVLLDGSCHGLSPLCRNVIGCTQRKGHDFMKKIICSLARRC